MRIKRTGKPSGSARRRWLLWALGAAVLLALLHRPILTAAASALILSEPPRKADFIVVLSGVANGEREAYAAQLFHRGLAPKVLVCGCWIAWKTNEADAMAAHLRHLGVPPSSILIEGDSYSTYTQALRCLLILRRHKARSILLVTSPTHSRRAARIFRQVLGTAGIVVASCPVPLSDSEFQLEGWWTRRRDVRTVAVEYMSWINRLIFRVN
ncbi:MAG: YdcF family protein [Armatimonadota bacterium]